MGWVKTELNGFNFKSIQSGPIIFQNKEGVGSEIN